MNHRTVAPVVQDPERAAGSRTNHNQGMIQNQQQNYQQWIEKELNLAQTTKKRWQKKNAPGQHKLAEPLAQEEEAPICNRESAEHGATRETTPDLLTIGPVSTLGKSAGCCGLIVKERCD